MALTTAQIQNAYVAFFNRPADVAGLTYWSSYAGSTADLLNTFAQSAEYKSLYSGLNNTQTVNAVYQNLFGHAPDVAGLQYWVTQLDQGKLAIGNIADAINKGAQGTDATIISNKVTAATAFTVALDTTAEIVAYAGVNSTGLAAVKAWLAAVTSDAATLTTATSKASLDSITTTVLNNVVSTGKTYTLAIGEDRVNGTDGNDAFTAPVIQSAAGNLTDTLDSADALDGGAGTDTLTATIQSGTPAPVLKNIENVSFRFTAAKSVDLSNSTGITSIKLENGTAAGTVNGVGSVASLSVSNQQQDVNFDSSTATTLALTLDTVANATGATQAKVDLGKATAAHKATTLNITANNANVELLDTKGTNVTTTLTVAATGTNTLKLTEAVKATAVTVTGTGSADLTGAAFTGALTKFDASANEGGVKADLQSTAIIAVTTGKGADTIKLNTAVVSGSSVDLGAGNDTLFAGAKLANLTKGANGGDGTDIISITDGSTLDATTAKYISNFETLDVSGGTGTYDVSLNSFATVQVDEAIAGALAGDIVFSNTANNFTLNLISKAKSGADFDVAKNTTINLKDSSGTTAKGTGETVTLTATFNDGNQNSSANGNINAQKVTVAGVENLVIQTSVGSTDGGTTAVKDSAYSLKANLVAAAAETITIKGAGSVDLSPANTIGVVTKIDASAATGNTTIDLSSHTKAVAFTGGDGVDTYKGSKAGDTIYTGKGADVVTFIADGTAAVRDTFVLKAKTDSQITDTSKDGKITLGSDTGFDSVTNFKTGAASTDDRLDLTNLGFSGAQRGVVDVNTKVVGTTDLTSIANLFNDPAGNRGVAISNLGGSDTYVFLDVNKDGNFTAADDIVIKLVAISTISETNINF